MKVLLRDLSPGTQYAIQFRSNNGENVSEWSQVQRFTTTNDTVRPGNVLNLSWYASGSTFIGQWDKVTTDEFGNPLNDFRSYRCNVTDGISNFDFFVVDPRFEFTKEMNESTFGTFKTALTLSVHAVDQTYNESPIAATVSVNPDNPPTPSTPVIGNYLGYMLVTWDGKSSAGASMPTNFNYVEVHVSTVSGFTPTSATYVGRLFNDGGANKLTVPGLTYETVYYVKLVAVNLLFKRSGTSAQASGVAHSLTGLVMNPDGLSPDTLNFTARDLGGANAYYSTSEPQEGVSGVHNLKAGDIWYDTDATVSDPVGGTYRYNGTTWVPDATIGVISGKKILTETLTADAIATNFFTAFQAKIGTAFIDELMVQSVNAAAIKTGSLQSDGSIIAGPTNDLHAEMRNTGFYVYGPRYSIDASGNQVAGEMVPWVRMGTQGGDTFTIPDPNAIEDTLASISSAGVGTFQGVSVRNADQFTVGGEKISDYLDNNGKGGIVGSGYIYPITGLNQSGSQGIRSEYGIGQFSFPVKAGRTYRIDAKLREILSTYSNPYAWIRLRYQQDARTQADIDAGLAATAVTNSSPVVMAEVLNMWATAGWTQTVNKQTFFDSTFTGIVSIGLSVEAGGMVDANSVLKVTDPATLEFAAVDIGKTLPKAGRMHNQGGSLYSWTAPPPPPPPATQQYYWEHRFNWVRSYKGTGAYMSNTDGRAYQGQDPSGYNGNQIGYFGFTQVDYASLAPYRIDRIVVYLYFAHWYYAGGGTARIGYHNQWGDPGGANRPGGIGGTFDSGGWPRGAAREIDITGWAGAFQNGSFRGIALGPGNNSYQNYGYATDCLIKVWWTG